MNLATSIVDVGHYDLFWVHWLLSSINLFEQ